MQFSYRY